jgi:preprotein translocase subunit SecE
MLKKLEVFFRDYSSELLQKVQWPKLDELQANTFTVLISSLVLALLIGVLDLVFSTSLTFIYDLFE